MNGMMKDKNFADDEFLLMYHGGIVDGRGIEMLLRVVAINKCVKAIILGNGEENYISGLKIFVESLALGKRVLFHKAVPQEELWKYVGAVDVGMILAPATCKNHLYSLPNKFFENIQSETPVICPNYPAMKEIVDKFKFGLTCDPTNIGEINNCVEKMRLNREFYEKCKDNIRVAKRSLCWEKEKVHLIEAYKNIL